MSINAHNASNFWWAKGTDCWLPRLKVKLPKIKLKPPKVGCLGPSTGQTSFGGELGGGWVGCCGLELPPYSASVMR